MKKKILLLSFFGILAFSGHAQLGGGNSITGTVISAETKLPLEYGTITIFTLASKKPLTGTTTDKTGSFTLTDIPSGTFTIVIENIGYKADTLSNVVVNKKDAIVELKNIALYRQKNTMQGVTVVAQAKLIENRIDKMVFNAERDLTSQTGVATDILKKIPQISVDADGNVELSGSSAIRFLINGKPSTAFGSNIADVLQSIPASQIKSIEVITNPGAKYDAQGLGGIINIILKSNNSKGYNGNISLTVGTRNENGSFNFNIRNNNFGVHAFFSGSERIPSNTSSSSYRVTTDSSIISILQQSSASRFRRHGYQTGTGFDWTIKKLTTISGNVSFNNFGYVGSGHTNQLLQPNKTGGLPDILSLTSSAYTYEFNNMDFDLNYKRKFKNDDQELEIKLNSSKGHNSSINSSDQYLLPMDSLYHGIRSNNPATTRETELAIDYTQPLKKNVNWGMGGKTVFNNITSNAGVKSFQTAGQGYLPDAGLSNYLNYKQQVYAVYTELSFPVGELFETKFGGRYERTEINSYYSNALTQVKVPGYNTFVPSIFFSKKISDNTTLKLSYSKRIERPGYEELNPYVNTSDPRNLSSGNPYLKPEIGQRFEMGYSRNLGKTGSLMVNLFYRSNDHDIQPFIVYYTTYKVVDSVYTDVSVSTRQNIGRENNAGINLFGDLHPTTKLNIRSNAFFYFRHTFNAIDAGYNTNSFNYRLNMNASYQFTNSMLAEFFCNFSSPRHEVQGTYPSFTSYTIALRKQFWQKKGSIALTATNPLSENLDQKTTLFGPNFTVNNERSIPFRSFGINFSWKFGKLEFKKEREENDSNLNGNSQKP